MAEAAIAAAFRLRPDAGEAHLARAQNLYRGYLDYAGALAELELAGQTLPNDASVFELKGYIQRRQGKQEEAVRSLERAIDLDPRNTFTLQQIALSYHHLRRYPEEKSVLDRALAIEPNDVDSKVARAFVDFHWKADIRPLHQVLDSIRATNPAATQSIADGWLICALAERDTGAAKNAVIAAGANPPFTDEAVNFTRPFVEAIIARVAKDDEGARSAFAAARVEQGENHPSSTKLRSAVVRAGFDRRRSWAQRGSIARRPPCSTSFCQSKKMQLMASPWSNIWR